MTPENCLIKHSGPWVPARFCKYIESCSTYFGVLQFCHHVGKTSRHVKKLGLLTAVNHLSSLQCTGSLDRVTQPNDALPSKLSASPLKKGWVGKGRGRRPVRSHVCRRIASLGSCEPTRRVRDKRHRRVEHRTA